MGDAVDIPEPPGLPLLGNIRSINPEFPLGSLVSLADQYGEIYRLRLPGRTLVVVSTRALVDEVCDEKRFKKSVNPALTEIRHGVHDGLFTALMGEENWGIAHRVLMPAFGPISIRGMFSEMHDIATQLSLKWARAGPDSPIMVTDDFTRLTLDTLAICSMGYRFNSYYSTQLHPFIEAMGDFLIEAGDRSRRPPFLKTFFRSRDEKFATDIEVLRSTARGVLESRKARHESRKAGHDDQKAGHDDRKDLLEAMLKGRDPKTSKKMTDENIMDNLITFLIAGHETTSGLISFAFYQLLRHPEIYQRAQKEVDRVVGKTQITVEHMSKLPYINGVLRETLRLNATIPVFTCESFEDTLLAGQYPVKKGEVIVNLLAKSHIDPIVFGDDVNEFKPERMMDEPFNKLNQEFPNSWKPFGNGIRACIGRPFAWQEALLVMAMLLQNFNFVLDPGYVLSIKQTLTIKPKDMHMRAILREGLTPITLQQRLAGLGGQEETPRASGGPDSSSGDGVPITILYGSNSGTCEALARRVAMDAPAHGFRASKVDCLDSAQGQLPKGQPVVIITASYEGQPPDNAGHFVAWIQDCNEGFLKDVSYAVFGCGHKDWAQTFHRIPRLVDSQLEKLGAMRVANLGLADASSGDIFTDFETWEDDVLWPSISEKFNISKEGKDKTMSTSGFNVAITAPRATTLRQDVKEAVVVDSQALTSTGDKRHIEIKLPKDMSYSVGDYLAVLPINPREIVYRVMRRLRLARDVHLEITTDEGTTALPTHSPVPAHELLSSYVELSQPATKRNLQILAEYATDEETKSELNRLGKDGYTEGIKAKHISVLDLLERFSDIDLPIAGFLSMTPPMRVRQYSISSSPLWNPSHVTITFSVLNVPSFSGQGSHIGVATSYLTSLLENDTLNVAVRPSHPAFSIPSNPQTIPIICIAAGSGLAPFRGFFQDRAKMLLSGRSLTPGLLFFGCRSPDQDDLYREEFDAWEELGAVEVQRAFSQAPEQSEGCKHVNDAIWKHRQRMVKLWKQGAKLYVCGASGIAESVKEAIILIKLEADGSRANESEAREWFEGLRNIRYVTDVFD